MSFNVSEIGVEENRPYPKEFSNKYAFSNKHYHRIYKYLTQTIFFGGLCNKFAEYFPHLIRVVAEVLNSYFSDIERNS